MFSSKYKRKMRKSKFFIIILITIMLLLAVGYAIYHEELNITGNADFKVYFIDAKVEDVSKGTATININI